MQIYAGLSTPDLHLPIYLYYWNMNILYVHKSTWCYTLFFPDACVSIPSPKDHFVGCDAWTPGWLGPLDGGEMFYMGDHF